MKTNEDLNNIKKNAACDTVGRTEEQYYVTIQNAEGSYEERLIVENPNNCPPQKQLQQNRYRIPEPPRLMRDIPKFFAKKKLIQRQVLQFDAREPGLSGRIWRAKNAPMDMPPKNAYSALRKMNMATKTTKRRQFPPEKNNKNSRRTNMENPKRRQTHDRQAEKCTQNIQTGTRAKRKTPIVVKTENNTPAQNEIREKGSAETTRIPEFN